ncbi:MAG: hypothetical protein NT142_17490 [Planctomycetota bacterium]|nr:hypothetical protein [Planctomycetota bacterium]
MGVSPSGVVVFNVPFTLDERPPAAEPVVIVRLGTITTFHFSDGNAPSKPFPHMDFGPIQCLKLARTKTIKHRGQQAASKGLLNPQPPLFSTCCILVGTLVVIPTRCARCVKVPGHGKFGIFRSYAVALILAFWEALISTQNTNSVPFSSKLVLLKLVHLAIFVSCEQSKSFRENFIDFLAATPVNATAMEAQRTNPVGLGEPSPGAYPRLHHRLETSSDSIGLR